MLLDVVSVAFLKLDLCPYDIFIISFHFCFLRQGLTLLPWLECSGEIIAHDSLKLLGSSEPPILAFQVAGTTGHHTQLIFVFLVETVLARLVSNS